jgi:xylan 1,4-beta-xylosidase
MLGMMTGARVAVRNPAAAPLDAMLSAGVKDKPDVHAMASADSHSVAVLVSNYHDSGKPGPPAPIDLNISGLPGGRLLLQHYRVDNSYSNSYELWKRMGSPPAPSPEQYAQLEQAGQLHLLESPRWITTQGGGVRVEFSLPRHGVSLLRVTW